MKKLLILPGNSPRNQAWGEHMAAVFSDQFDEIHLQLYDHWESGEKVIDVPTELDKIIDTVTEDTVDQWYICAKSVGTLVAVIAVHESIIQPQKCVFFGMPLDLAAEELFKDNWEPLSDFSVPTLAFHNQDDPVTSCTYSAEKVSELSTAIEFVITPGDTHEYIDNTQYKEQVKQFFVG